MCEAPAEAPAVPYDQVSAGGSGSLCEPQRGDNVVIYNSPTTSFCVTLGLSIKFIAVGEAQDDIDIEQGTDSCPPTHMNRPGSTCRRRHPPSPIFAPLEE